MSRLGDAMTPAKREPPRSIRIDPAVKEAVKELAEKENRSFNNMVETLLKEALEARSALSRSGVSPKMELK